VKSSPPEMRSEVLSGFGVQITVIQLVGKGVFPLAEFGLHRGLRLEDSLMRYRIHMGMCTFFCFYGTFALFLDRKNVRTNRSETVIAAGRNDNDDAIAAIKYDQKHSDVVDGFLEGGSISVAPDGQQSTLASPVIPSAEIELSTRSDGGESKSPSFDTNSGDNFTDYSRCDTSASSSFLNEPEQSKTEPRTIIVERSERTQKNKRRITAITLTFALLLQSVATTVLAVLWPLLAHDTFDLSARTFGILSFLSSVVSTGAVAAFPVVERMEKVGGRVRSAAWGFGIGSVFCFAFCFCLFGEYWGAREDISGAETGLMDTNETNSREEQQQYDAVEQLHSRKQLGLHALSAMAFQAVLCFLEPSLKSILSLVVSPSSASSSSSKGSSLGGTIGFMQTLGSIGGMVGNLAGTWMYKLSKDGSTKGRQIFFRGGSMPFVVTAFLMAVSSILIWRLEEPWHFAMTNVKDSKEREYESVRDTDVENGRFDGDAGDDDNSEPVEDSEKERPDGCCLVLRETTYDLKLD